MKRYNTNFKKKVDIERDMYLPKRSPKGLLWCRGCGSIYYRRRWTLSPMQEIRDRVESGQGVSSIFCPACRKIHDHYPAGEVRLQGVLPDEKRQVLSILRNEEDRAREKNPLERIMDIQIDGRGWRIETTTEKLAQRLGRCLRKARGGSVTYKWSHNNKFARVVWEKREQKNSVRA